MDIHALLNMFEVINNIRKDIEDMVTTKRRMNAFYGDPQGNSV